MLRCLYTLLIICYSFMVIGCNGGTDNKHIEKQIRGEVLRESSGIATLEAIYTLVLSILKKIMLLQMIFIFKRMLFSWIMDLT